METYIDYIAKGILDIDTPEWIEVGELDTSTQIAAADIEKNVIYTKKGTDEKMLFFAIAHELRHLWQKEHKNEMIKQFNEEKMDINKYNDQEAEIDANAFATAIMVLMFGIRPLFKTLGEETREKIYAQTEIIMNELEKE